MTHLFCTLDSQRIADLIRSAKRFVCYAGPGVQMAPAQAMTEVAGRLGVEMITVALDFDERVMRLGFGDLEAVEALRAAGIRVSNAPGLRTALVLVDDAGYSFAPTALYLEAEAVGERAANAMRLSTEQLREALARLSPAAKKIAIAQTTNQKKRKQIASVDVEIESKEVTEEEFERVKQNLKKMPPVKFDLERQVRVFNAYLQYVELKLTGADIQRHRLTIPQNILKLGVLSEDLEGRWRTTFDLIEKDGKLSPQAVNDELKEIRKNFTRSLGDNHGRVVLKIQKTNLDNRLKTLEEKLAAYQEKVDNELQGKLDESREKIVNYYLKRAVESPPDAMLGQILNQKPTEDDARRWLDTELDQAMPKAESLIKKMHLEVRYKDLTFETLKRPDFLKSVKDKFQGVDWDKLYKEFRAAPETGPKA